MADETNNGAEAGAEAARQERLEEQIARLQADIMAISATLQRLTGEKIADAQKMAGEQYGDALRQGRQVLEDVTDQAGEFERTLKRTIRERPLTAVASALGIGYLLAMLSRR